MLHEFSHGFFAPLAGFCPHLWCREPSGVHNWIHQRSNQKVLLHRKVNWYTPAFFFFISFVPFSTVCNFWTADFIYVDCICVCRDSLLASLLDGVRASGNRDVCVKMAPTQRGQRWGLLSMPVDEEVESLHLKFLAAPPSECEILFIWYIGSDEMTADIYYSQIIIQISKYGFFYNVWTSCVKLEFAHQHFNLAVWQTGAVFLYSVELFNHAFVSSAQMETLLMPCSDLMPTYPTAECFMQWLKMCVRVQSDFLSICLPHQISHLALSFSFFSSGSFLWEQREAHQQCHSGTFVPGGWTPCP